MVMRIYGNPVAQGRPRAFRRGNFIGMYDPEKSKSWKETIKWQAIEQKVACLEGALKMRLDFLMPRPKSLSKKVCFHVKRPDLDNCIKAVKDALHGICYKDDSQIVELHAYKKYAGGEVPPGVLIEIEGIK